MLERCTTAQERWGGVDKLIDRWLAERSKLVEHYIALRDRQDPDISTQQLLNNFCSCLVDYVSAGHFAVYEQLVRGAEEAGDERALGLIRQVIPRIETSPPFAVLFNGYYGASSRGTPTLDVMHSRLMKLAHLLLERFELEDCLIEVLHTAYHETHVTETM